MNKFKKLLLASSILVATGAANAGYTVNTSDTDAVSFGGFIKIDARHVSGDVAYQDAWYGAGLATALTESKSTTSLFAKESRFNMKYTHGDVMGFIELDFFGGGGNEVISNSVHPRLRHAFIKYDQFLVGQTWTTLMNTSALAETLDFAGPINGGVFARQTQVRYTNGGLQLSLENPESYKGDASQDSIPDFIAKYTFKGDWGNVSVAGVVRQLNTSDVAAVLTSDAVAKVDRVFTETNGVVTDNGAYSTTNPTGYRDAADAVAGNLASNGKSETAVGYSIAGRIKTIGQDDFRFQYHSGEVGRYVGVVSGTDLKGQEVEETDSYLVAYRHFWSEGTRSTLAYGHAEADISGLESTQVSVNIMKSLTKQLTIGLEVGNYSRDDKDVDSDYAQLSLKYVL